MADFNQQYGIENNKLPLKPILIGVGGVLVVIILVIAVVRIIQPTQQTDLTRAISQVEQATDLCADASNAEGCTSGKVTDFAEQFGEVEVCEMHETVEGQDSCVWTVAREIGEPDACKGISVEEDEVACIDSVNLLLAIDQNDVSFCEAIANQSAMQRCIVLLTPNIDPCHSDADGSVCSDDHLIELAAEALDATMCVQLTDTERRDECSDAVTEEKERDTDDDGLTDLEEATYGTDPTKPDTDGDGYTDKGEIDAGYNPLGDGAL